MNIGTGILKIVATGVLLGSISAGALASGLSPVHGNVPAMVSGAKMTGHHNPRSSLTVSIALPPANQAQLTQFLHDLGDRSSPNYHKYLKPGQFAQLYGPKDQAAAVKAYLVQHGIPAKGITTSPNYTRLHFTATTAVIESLFGVAVNDYSYQGTTFYSNTSDPLVPASLGVKAIFGLEDGVQWRAHNVQGPVVAQPRAGAGPSGFSPLQIETAYDWPDITNTGNGAGVTIAIATAFTFRSQDLTKFWDTYGLPHHSVTITAIDGTTKVLNGETTLDIERSSSMAPGAAIHVYECSTPANQTFDDEFLAIANNDSEQVVSTSWGRAEIQATQFGTPSVSFATLGAEHDDFVQMKTQGQIVMAAAGDDGAADRAPGSDNADFPSSDPYVIAAGGTTLTLNPDNTINTEAAWSTVNGQGGAGGADSMFFAEPDYETNSPGWVSNTSCAEDVIDDPEYTHSTDTVCAAQGNPSRQSSDIALDADPQTGYSIYYNGRWEMFGGTSFVAPELAGFFANLIQQSGGGNVGPGPKLVFCLATDGNNNPGTFTTFNDITSGNNGFPAATGWDHATGWGSFDAQNLITDYISDKLASLPCL
ncbi:MAG TPA: S53 family peptidase [Gammaproteobacteria bacterium]